MAKEKTPIRMSNTVSNLTFLFSKEAAAARGGKDGRIGLNKISALVWDITWITDDDTAEYEYELRIAEDITNGVAYYHASFSDDQREAMGLKDLEKFGPTNTTQVQKGRTTRITRNPKAERPRRTPAYRRWLREQAIAQEKVPTVESEEIGVIHKYLIRKPDGELAVVEGILENTL